MNLLIPRTRARNDGTRCLALQTSRDQPGGGLFVVEAGHVNRQRGAGRNEGLPWNGLLGICVMARQENHCRGFVPLRKRYLSGGGGSQCRGHARNNFELDV